MQVQELLRIGKDNSVSRAYLKKVLNIDDRTLFAQVARERVEGAVILTDGHGGYYIPDPATAEGQAQIRKFEIRMYSMARNTIAATNGAWKADKQHQEGSNEST